MSFKPLLFFILVSVQCIAQDSGAELFRSKCVSCHHSAGSAPIDFQNLNTVIKLRSTIISLITKNTMPPWNPDPTYSHFKNERILNASQKSSIINWVSSLNTTSKQADKLAGVNPIDKPSTLINLVYKEKIILPTNTHDTVIKYEIPFSLKDEVDVNQIVFYCNALPLIHHVNYFVIDSNKIKQSSNSGMDNLGDAMLRNTVITLGYAPGNLQEAYRDSFGFRLPKSGIIQGDLHISQVQRKTILNFGFHFMPGTTPITHYMHIFPNANFIQSKVNYDRLEIPANEVKTFINCSENLNDIAVVYCHPHMHVYGKSMFSFAVTPSNDTIPLIRINQWNFYKQEFYEFEQAIFIPAHSKIYLIATYDNTTNNPLNPFTPPRLVEEGSTTFNEMLLDILLFVDP